MQLWTERLRRAAGHEFPEKVTAFREDMAVTGAFACRAPCGTPVQPSATPTTDPTTARAARQRFASWRIARCRGCLRPTGAQDRRWLRSGSVGDQVGSPPGFEQLQPALDPAQLLYMEPAADVAAAATYCGRDAGARRHCPESAAFDCRPALHCVTLELDNDQQSRHPPVNGKRFGGASVQALVGANASFNVKDEREPFGVSGS